MLDSVEPYSLEEELDSSPEHKVGLYTWQDLVEIIQASKEEIKATLKSLSAMEIDEYWRIIDEKTMNETLDIILRNSIMHDWPISALREESVLSILAANGFPPRIVAHCLETHGSKVDGSEGTLWSLDERWVCLRFALQILSRGKMRLETFMESWKQSVPSRMKPDLKMLKGEVLYDRTGLKEWIRIFNASALPSTPSERFAKLFLERPKWECKDLDPYQV